MHCYLLPLLLTLLWPFSITEYSCCFLTVLVDFFSMVLILFCLLALACLVAMNPQIAKKKDNPKIPAIVHVRGLKNKSKAAYTVLCG